MEEVDTNSVQEKIIALMAFGAIELEKEQNPIAGAVGQILATIGLTMRFKTAESFAAIFSAVYALSHTPEFLGEVIEATERTLPPSDEVEELQARLTHLQKSAGSLAN